MASNLRKRTPAQRAAIDVRAAAWERPLSMMQRSALVSLSLHPLAYTVAGWARQGSGGLGAFRTGTIESLVRMGYARIYRLGRRPVRATITGAGRTMARVC